MSVNVLKFYDSRGKFSNYVIIRENFAMLKNEHKTLLKNETYQAALYYIYNNVAINLYVVRQSTLEPFLNQNSLESVQKRVNDYIESVKTILENPDTPNGTWLYKQVPSLADEFLSGLGISSELFKNKDVIKENNKKQAELEEEQKAKRQAAINREITEKINRNKANLLNRIKDNTGISGDELLDLATDYGYVIPIRTKGLILNCHSIRTTTLSYQGKNKKPMCNNVFVHYNALREIILQE